MPFRSYTINKTRLLAKHMAYVRDLDVVRDKIEVAKFHGRDDEVDWLRRDALRLSDKMSVLMDIVQCLEEA